MTSPWCFPDAKSAQAALDRKPARHTYAIEVSFLAPDERPDLAARVGLETQRFKRRVRQLKGLGQTISLDVGYRISPRGREYLARQGTIER